MGVGAYFVGAYIEPGPISLVVEAYLVLKRSKITLPTTPCEVSSWQACLLSAAMMSLARVVVLPLPKRIATVLI